MGILPTESIPILVPPTPTDDRDTFDPMVAEKHFQALGRFRGPLATDEVQTAAHEYWLAAGTTGAIWLAGRLRTECNVEALHASGSQLADLGEVALAPILTELDRQPTVDQAIALLRALAWMIDAAPTLRSPDAATEATLGRLLQSREADIREAAARALPLIPPDRGLVWLESRLNDEKDGDVSQTIQEVLDHLRVMA